MLDVFYSTDEELALAEIAARARLPKATAHRFVTDLIQWGALERTASGLRLGIRLFELGQLVPHQRNMRNLAMPFLHDLYERTECTVNLAMRDGNEVVYIEKFAGKICVPTSRPGGRLPIHATALGKVLLAFSNEAVIRDILKKPLHPMTPKTLTEPGKIRGVLSEVRRNWVAFDDEESHLGLHCVAAPIVNCETRQIVAGISVSGIRSYRDARLIAPVVLEAAFSMSKNFGGDDFEGSAAQYSLRPRNPAMSAARLKAGQV